MPSTFSPLKIELIATGEQSGTWGATTNTNLGTALEDAITGSADVAFSSADVTVTLTDTNAAQTARNLRLNLTGTSGGARNLILGSGCQIEKLYLINNGLADAVTVKNTTGTGIAVPAGKTMFVYNNGTNVVDATTHLSSLTTGTLSASGVATFSAGTVSAPAITTTGDTNTGIFFPTADTIAFTEGGVESMRIDSSGNVGIGTVSPSVKLEVSGRVLGDSLVAANAVYIWSQNRMSLGASYGIESQQNSPLFMLTQGVAQPIVFGTNSTERMRIDSSGNVGIGTSTPSSYAFGLAIDNTNATNTGYVFNLLSSGSSWFKVGRLAASSTAIIQSGQDLSLQPDSGNVGIGTSSPATKVEISGTAAAQNLALRITNTATDGYSTLQLGGSGDGGVFRNGSTQTLYGGASSLNLITVGAHPIGFATGNTLRAIITSTGKVGIGTTPAAWDTSANSTVLQIYSSSILDFLGAQVDFGLNTYYDGSNYRRIGTAEASRYSQGSGTHFWSTAASGSAGSTITWSEQMRITAAGNVGIGTSSPGARLQVNQTFSTGTGLAITGASSQTVLTTDFATLWMQNTNTTNNNYNALGFVNDQGGYSSAIYGIYTDHTSGSQSGAIAFSTRNAGSFAERMRITSTGSVTLVANTTKGPYIRAGDQNAVANNGTITITNATAGGALICVYNPGSGLGGVFWANYSSTVTKIAGDGEATDTGVSFAVYKGANSHVTTFKNRDGGTSNYTIAVYSALANN